MQKFLISPREMVTSFWRNRSLIYALVKRDVISRYRGSFLGLLWSFFNPVFMLTVYTFVFGVIFRSRWGSTAESKTEFALVLFVGLMVFNLFSECANRAPTIIVANANYVKKVIFPLEILPWVVLGAAFFQWLISLIVWMIFYVLLFGVPKLTILLLPIAIIPLGLMTIGLSWWLASLGTYLRDVSQVIGIVVTALMFLAPIFYPETAVPEKYRVLLFANPLTTAIDEIRDVLFWGKIPDPREFLLYLACSLLIAWLGFAWFQKTRKGFADVL